MVILNILKYYGFTITGLISKIYQNLKKVDEAEVAFMMCESKFKFDRLFLKNRWIDFTNLEAIGFLNKKEPRLG